MSLEAACCRLPAEQQQCSMLRIVTSSGCCKRHCLTNIYLRESFAPSYRIQDAFHSVNCANTPDSCSRLQVHWQYLPDADVDGSEDAVSAAWVSRTQCWPTKRPRVMLPPWVFTPALSAVSASHSTEPPAMKSCSPSFIVQHM